MDRQPSQSEEFSAYRLGGLLSITSPYSFIFTRRKRNNLVYAIFSSEAKKGMRVLEIGCGSGANIFMLNELYPKAEEIEFYGVDISPMRIRFANSITRWKGRTGNCHFNLGTAEKLGYSDGQFDMVICTEVLEHLLDSKIALKEMNRVLKKGGVAVISTPIRDSMPRKIIRDRIEDIIERRATKGNPNEMVDGSYGHISVLSTKELILMSKDACFRVEKKMKQSLVHGWHFLDRHQVIFAILLIMDAVLDRLPHSYRFSWGIVLKLRKT